MQPSQRATLQLSVVLVLANATAASAQCVDAWIPLPHTGPSPRFGAAMAYDSTRGIVLLHGGNSYAGTVFSDTWTWNGLEWSRIEENSSTGLLWGHAMAYDSLRDRMVVFGGRRPDQGAQAIYSSSTYEWDGAAWQFVVSGTPSERQNAAMVFDTGRGRTMLFGGYTFTVFADTWEWNGSSWHATSAVPGVPPPHSNGYKVAYDSARHVTVLFGDGKTYEWDGSAWTQTSNFGPLQIYNGAMCFSQARNRTIHFGGRVQSDNNGQTWEYNGNTRLWTLVANSGPSPRWSASCAYDENRKAMVLFGGLQGDVNSQASNETWVRTAYPVLLSLSATATVCPSGSPTFNATATGSVGSGPVMFHWEWRESTAMTWRLVADGVNRDEGDIGRFVATGSTTNSLTLSRVANEAVWNPAIEQCEFRVRLSNSCGAIGGPTKRINVCRADLTCDGGVDIDDLLAFLSSFELGSLFADLDNGSSTGTPDGGIDINDLLFFLLRFEAGC